MKAGLTAVTTVSGVRMRHRSEIGARTMGSRVTRAAVGSLALVLTLAACGHAAAPVTQGDAIQAERVATTMGARVLGSSADAQSLTRLTFTAYQGSIRACMSGKGWTYTPHPLITTPTEWALIPFDEDVFQPVDSVTVARDGLGLARDSAFNWSHAEQDARARNPGLPRDEAGQGRYGRDVDVCQPAQDSYDLWGRYHVDTLISAWETARLSVANSAAVRDALAGYARCMAEAGFAVESREQLVRQLKASFQGPDASVIDPASAQFKSAAEAEAKASVADAACRRGAHDVAMVALAAELPQFEADHAAELTASDDLRARLHKDYAAAAAAFADLQAKALATVVPPS